MAGASRGPAAVPPLPALMRAVAQERYGGPEVLRVIDAPLPEAGPGEVLVRVIAAGVDRGVWHLMTGTPVGVRLGIGLRAPRERVRGREVAGEVVAVGPGVTAFAIGDRVFGAGHASFAEFTRARVDRLAGIPAGVAWEQAAASATSGTTALQAVRLLGLTAAGDPADSVPAAASKSLLPDAAGRRVLVTGAAGGVGSLAVHLLRSAGAHVIGAASPARLEFARTLCDEVVETGGEYGEARLRALAPVDGLVSTSGIRSYRMLCSLLADGGTAVLVGAEGGRGLLGGFERQLLAPLLGSRDGRRLRALTSVETPELLADLGRLLADGRLRVPIHGEYALDATADALRDLQEGRVTGKAIIRIGAEADAADRSPRA
ncbi:NAD(P)-dependent alcohol dehydrogenase [Schumannella luteola]|uniref:NADPH:quinone reductase-like Zn-dependent oxidoreductase n=1 Tax=Schumannella luteola TaxID=472059 RepID=A0A852YD33_9MICO|nr:NAD(P)-dependent alcohol dehydrogenase [Schumannella luteola]NYG99210.1 NADPH:quinone reductase-like Zn-dependent oxidoreductase [Schumannella luteola]TPX02520.1 NAD(P)-dependent alcohol dehydrogenase [Schumannella luteola]